jgi:hypothetical protein
MKFGIPESIGVKSALHTRPTFLQTLSAYTASVLRVLPGRATKLTTKNLCCVKDINFELLYR